MYVTYMTWTGSEMCQLLGNFAGVSGLPATFSPLPQMHFNSIPLFLEQHCLTGLTLYTAAQLSPIWVPAREIFYFSTFLKSLLRQ
uniref:Uncharacterized protein n=1 Tax=Anguilla anguilla TaxID=7936 RepID=A0A0E9XIP1_ANGAN